MSNEQKIKDAQRLLGELNNESSLNEQERKKLLKVLQQGVFNIQTPGEFLWTMMFNTHEYAATKVAMELDLAGLIAEHGQATASQLAEWTKADKLVIVRVMRVMTALGVFTELGPESYSPGKISSYLVQDRNLEDGMKVMFDSAIQAVVGIPRYLEETKYQDPSGRQPSIFASAFGKDVSFFSWVGSNPRSLQQFQNLMVGQRNKRAGWLDMFPAQEELIDGFDPNISDVLLVDVGGGQGGELQTFKKRFPDAPGKLVLQELPKIIKSCPHLDQEGIVIQVHDFFTPQPIKGARGYHMRSITHDWPNEKVFEILLNLKPALKKGYSKIFINDWVLSDTNAERFSAALDINMMTLFNSMERSHAQFQDLIAKAGMKIVKIWGVAETERCIEVMLAE